MNSQNNVNYVLTLKDLFSAQIKNAISESERLNKTVEKTQSTLSGMAGIASTVFAGIGLSSLGAGILETGQQFENAEMGLTTLLKSSEKAHEVFNQIKQDAVSTPFDFGTLLDANRALIGAGESSEKARQTVLALGNAISASGKGNEEFQRMVFNLQQIKNVGKATAMDIKQFGIAGINIYGVLAEATGKTVEEARNMEVSYDMLSFALQKAQGAGGMFENGLANAMNTTSGKISNLGDSFDEFKNTLFIELKPVIDKVIEALFGLIDGGKNLISFIKENKAEIGSLAFAIGGLTLAYNMNNIISSITLFKTGLLTAGTILHTIATIASITATEGLSAGMLALNIAMSANPIGVVVAGLTLLTAGIIYAYNKFDGFRRILDTTWEVIKGFGGAIVSSLVTPFKLALQGAMGLWNVLTGDFSGAKENLKAMGDAIVAPFTKVKNGIIEAKKVYQNFKPTKEEETGLKGAAKNLATATAPELAMPSAPDKPSKARAEKAVNIHINIGKLIETQQIRVENASKDFVNRIHEEVSKALLLAVNDANRIGNQ